MGLFSSIKITNKHVDLLNTYLPEEIQVNTFKLNDLEALQVKIKHYISRVKKDLREKADSLIKLKEERLFDKYRLFNVPLNGKSLGLVDVGLVQRFSSKSTGNSFENGMLQHAIETSFEKVWAENNAQYNSVMLVKNRLKHKAMELYPESNAIENFQINFRELGNSGNVFIYANGTAVIADSLESVEMDEEIKTLIQQVKTLNIKLEDAQEKSKALPPVKVIKSRLKEI